MVDVAEFRSAYLAEVDDHLEAAGAHLLALERAAAQGQADPRAVREVFRALHTIKGLSAMMGVEPIVALSHRMEGALRSLQQSGAPAPATVDTFFQGIRAIEQRVRALAEGATVPEPPTPLLEALDALLGVEPSPRAQAEAPALTLPAELEAKLGDAERQQITAGIKAGRRAVRADFSPSPARAEQGLTITSVRERLGALAEIVKVIPLSRPPSDETPGGLTFALVLLTAATDEVLADAAGLPAGDVTPLSAPRAAVAVVPPPDPSGPGDLTFERGPDLDELPRRGVIRVELERIDEAMDRLSALVVTRYRLERCAADMGEAGAPVRELTRLLGEQARELRDLRAALLRVRMVPISEILERLPLILRGIRRSTGKQVRLEVEGAGAELDKAVAERLFPAIIHLVRNAVDHGIEAPEERERAGKPREGTLRITCSAASTAALDVLIADDGRGVDRAEVARRAGVAAEPQSDADLLDLLCAPGFSTRTEATTTSGRGMGLNIAKRVVTADLGGELTLRSQPGAGTTFALRVPLSVAIVDAFAFQCADQRFVAPVAMIDEIVEVDPASVWQGPGRTPFFERRGTAVPLVSLEAALWGESGRASAASSVDRATTNHKKALIVRRGGEPTAFTVDRLLGQREAVIRPLADPLVKVTGVSGATDLGDGRPTLVLDLMALAAALGGGRSRALAEVR